MSFKDPIDDRHELFSEEYLLLPRDVEKAQKQLMEMAQEQTFRIKLSRVFSTDEGMEVLEWLLEAMRMHQTAFTGNAYTNYNCALKDFAGMLHDLVLHANPVLACRLIQRRYEGAKRKELAMQAQLENFIEKEVAP